MTAALAPATPSATPLAQPRPDVHRWILCAVFAWIVLHLAAALHLVLYDTLEHSVDLLFDDAYYYLGVAWNLGHGHGSRFTEPLATNGYHPLWLGLLATLTAVFDLSKRGLVCTTLIVTALVQCAGLWLFDRGTADPVRRTIGRLAIFLAMIKFSPVFGAGMETTLFVLFIPWLLRLAGRRGWTTRHALHVGALFALVFLTRLDALALDAVILALAIVTRRAALKQACIAALPLLAGLLVYAIVNQAFFDTPLPVSGQAKAIGSHLAGNLATSIDFFRPLQWTVAMLAAWAIACLVLRRRLPFAGFELASLALALIACALYYGVLSGWPIWAWYLYPTAFVSIYATQCAGLATVALVSAGTAALGQRVPRSILTTVVSIVVIAAIGLYLAKVVASERIVRGHVMAWAFDREIRDPARSTFNVQNVALLPWLAQHYPAGAVIAMGDRAGGLGYWMPERYSMVQIEGLVADRAFLKVLATGTLEGFLAARRVDLYISDRPRAFEADGISAFVEPIQPRITDGPANVLCFRERDALLVQDYAWFDDPQSRRVFAFDRRVACPATLLARIETLRARYDGIRSYSGL